MQPWKWHITENGLRVDLDGDETNTDYQRIGDYISIGTAIENMNICAQEYGYKINWAYYDHSPSAALGQLSIIEPSPHPWYKIIPKRCTNRQSKTTEASPFPKHEFEHCQSIIKPFGASIEYIDDKKTIDSFSQAIYLADRVRFFNPTLHKELMSEIRWSKKEAETTRNGIDINTLELSAKDIAGLSLMKDWSVTEFIKKEGSGLGIEDLTNKLLNHTSAILVLSHPNPSHTADILSGQAFQQLWLYLTEIGYGVHPWTTALYLWKRLENDSNHFFDSDDQHCLQEARTIFSKHFNSNLNEERVLFRIFKTSDAPQHRSLRCDLSDIVQGLYQ